VVTDRVDTLGRRYGQRYPYKRLPQTPGEWRTQALCNPNNTPDVDPVWQWKHPERMLALCRHCPVTVECLAEQKVLRVDGAWGGKRFAIRRSGRTVEVPV
jgi:hypothetical protein